MADTCDWDHDPIMLATGADDAFAMPMAVMIFSALANLEPGRAAKIFVLSDGISPESRRKVERAAALTGRKVELHWIEAELGELGSLAVTRWHKSVAYLRLRLPEFLSGVTDRVIYLDSDIVVEGDLSELWRTPLDGHLGAGVQNFDPPLLGGALAEPARQLGLDPALPYYNSGVMIMDLPRWRSKRMLERITELSQRFADYVDSADQDGTNLAVAGDWAKLDPRWNVQLLTVAVHGAETERAVDELRADRRRLLAEARVLHYTGGTKPWHHMYRKPKGDRFLHYLGRCGWMGPAEFAGFALMRRAEWQAIAVGRIGRDIARKAAALVGFTLPLG